MTEFFGHSDTQMNEDAHPGLRCGNLFGVTTVVGEYDAVLSSIRGSRAPVIVAYAHFDVLLRCERDATLRSLLSRCSLTYLDGIGSRLAFRVLYGRPVARINATDMNHRLLRQLASEGKRIAMVGALPESINALRRSMHKLGVTDSRLLIRHGFGELENAETVDKLRSFRPDVLFVGMGTPRQFEWLASHLDLNLAPLTVLTGGFFEILAETKRRAPRWMQYFGLEWLHRLLLEPGRLWKRYLIGIPRFLYALLRAKLRQT